MTKTQKTKVAIDEYLDYNKWAAALKESLQFLIKSMGQFLIKRLQFLIRVRCKSKTTKTKVEIDGYRDYEQRGGGVEGKFEIFEV